MGWGSGAQLMVDVIVGLNGMPDDNRKVVYRVLIPAMQHHDWDTELDCMGLDDAYDETLRDLHPDWFVTEPQSEI